MRKLFLAIPLFVFAACNNNQPAEEVNPDADIVVEAPAITVYGDSTVTPDNAIEAQEFLTMMEGKDTLQTKLKGKINETCKVKGCWMTLDMGNGEEMRVKFKDYGFFVPKEGVDGKTVIIEGFAYTDTVSVEELRHLAEDAGKSKEEIAQINAPEVGVNFEATGVIIQN